MLMYYHVGWHVGAFTLWNVCRLRIGFDAPPMSGFTRSRRIQPVNRTGDQLKHDRRGTRVGYKRINFNALRLKQTTDGIRRNVWRAQ